LGITATTIYNYFAGKDELNLMIRVRGFETLQEMLRAAYTPRRELVSGIEAMIRAYLEFGRTYPDYYDLMFNLNTPKYLDYVGTAMEPTARFEKETALQCLALFVEPLKDYITAADPEKDRFILNITVQFWSELHGLVALYNSRLFHEVLADVEAFVEERIQRLIMDVHRVKEKIDQGLPLAGMYFPIN
ncbi:MAG: TetR/AcrR family transcriptional regulator, partial [Desulfosudaceae bacterium]